MAKKLYCITTPEHRVILVARSELEAARDYLDGTHDLEANVSSVKRVHGWVECPAGTRLSDAEGEEI